MHYPFFCVQNTNKNTNVKTCNITLQKIKGLEKKTHLRVKIRKELIFLYGFETGNRALFTKGGHEQGTEISSQLK